MTLKYAIYNELISDSATIALVAHRIYPDNAPEGTPEPYVIYSVIADPQEHACGNDTTLGNPLIQIDVFGFDGNTVDATAAAIKSCLQDLTGLLGGGSGYTVERIYFEGTTGNTFENETGLFHAIMEFEIHHQ